MFFNHEQRLYTDKTVKWDKIAAADSEILKIGWGFHLGSIKKKKLSRLIFTYFFPKMLYKINKNFRLKEGVRYPENPDPPLVCQSLE